MIGKKSKQHTDTGDFSSLDAAVSELAKQTEALLGDPKKQPKSAKAAAKPPKKGVSKKPKSRGHSFDIISQPKQGTTLPATLKSAPPKQAHATASQPVSAPREMLSPQDIPSSEKAAESIGPEETSVSDEQAASDGKPEDALAIVGHKSKVLRLGDDAAEEVAESTEADEADAEPSAEKPAPASQTGITFTEPDEPSEGDSAALEEQGPAESTPGEDAQLGQVAQSAATELDIQLEAKVKAEASSDVDKEPEVLASNPADTGELTANNLVKDSTPKGYRAHPGQQKPTVFDTKEYHPELHDWSHLSRPSRAPFIILLLLIAVLGAITYFVVLGQKLPF